MSYTRPHITNGDFDADDSVVRWRGSLNGPSFGLPMLCLASWSVPNAKFQTEHFGNVALKGEALAKFTALFAELTPPQQGEFAEHLQTLKPGDALRGRALTFSFAGPADERARTTAAQLAEILAEKL